MKDKGLKNLFIDLGASVFKAGYFPIASGTVGTAATIPLVVLLKYLCPTWVFVLITILLLPVSFYIAHQAEKLYQEKDSSKIVIDELVGYFVTCLYLPALRWDVYVAAFFLFRFFDIIKLWPANYFDKKTGGISVVLDDVFAGIYANILLQVYYYFTVVFFVTKKVAGS